MKEKNFNLLASLLSYILSFGWVFMLAKGALNFGQAIVNILSRPESFFTNKVLFALFIWVAWCALVLYIIYYIGNLFFKIGYYFYKRYKDGSKDTD